MRSRSVHLASMAMVAMAMAEPKASVAIVDDLRSEPKPKPKAPPRNDEMHLKAAAEKRARKAAKLREIQERNARKQ